MKTLLCLHSNRIDVGTSVEGIGSLNIYWCPNCGAIKRTMTNWKYTDYPWVKPSNNPLPVVIPERIRKRSKSMNGYKLRRHQKELEKRVARVLNGPDTTFGD